MLFDLKNILWPYWRRTTCQLVVCPPPSSHRITIQPVVQEWTADRTCLADILCKDCNTRAKTGRGSTQSAAGSITFGPFPGLLPPHWYTSGTETSSSARGLDTVNISIMQCHVVLDSYLTCHALFVLSISSTTLILGDKLWLSQSCWIRSVSRLCPGWFCSFLIETLCIHTAPQSKLLSSRSISYCTPG